MTILLNRYRELLTWRQVQWFLFGIAPILSGFAWLAAGEERKMHLPGIAVGAWLLGICLVVVGNWSPSAKSVALSWLRSEKWLLVSLFISALLLRALMLDRIPWLLTSDEGSVGLWAIKYVKGEVTNIFIDGWFSFPSFYYFLESLAIRLLGQTIPALRLSSALAGAATVACLYGYGRTVFGRGVALVAAAYLMTFPFHIHFSRLALQNVWDSLSWAALSFMFFRAWRNNERLHFAWAGLVLGLAPYFYVTSRSLFLILALWLGLAFIKDRASFYQRVPGLLSMLLAMIVVLLPLALFFVHHPAEFNAPLTRVSLWKVASSTNVSWTSSMFWRTLEESLQASALAFTGTRLRGPFYSPGTPILLPLPAAMFLLGLVFILLNPANLEMTWLLLSLFAVVIVGAFSESTPAAQRYILTAPAVAMVIALAMVKIKDRLTKILPNYRWQIAALLGGLLVLAMLNDLRFYFIDYSGERHFGDDNTEVANAVAYFLLDHARGGQVYFAGAPRMGYFSHSTIPYLVPEDTGHDLTEPVTSPLDWPLSGSTTFIILPERQAELAPIQQSYPGGLVFQSFGREDRLLFTAYVVSSP
jgi:4-amino-4-deoxy-L-arabinose transferase-like glycosyltransferase